VIPVIEIPIELKTRLLNDYENSNVSEPIVEEATTALGYSVRYGVPLAFLQEYPYWKEYVIG
jgi:hypothetical protein